MVKHRKEYIGYHFRLRLFRNLLFLGFLILAFGLSPIKADPWAVSWIEVDNNYDLLTGFSFEYYGFEGWWQGGVFNEHYFFANHSDINITSLSMSGSYTTTRTDTDGHRPDFDLFKATVSPDGAGSQNISISNYFLNNGNHTVAFVTGVAHAPDEIKADDTSTIIYNLAWNNITREIAYSATCLDSGLTTSYNAPYNYSYLTLREMYVLSQFTEGSDFYTGWSEGYLSLGAIAITDINGTTYSTNDTTTTTTQQPYNVEFKADNLQWYLGGETQFTVSAGTDQGWSNVSSIEWKFNIDTIGDMIFQWNKTTGTWTQTGGLLTIDGAQMFTETQSGYEGSGDEVTAQVTYSISPEMYTQGWLDVYMRTNSSSANSTGWELMSDNEYSLGHTVPDTGGFSGPISGSPSDGTTRTEDLIYALQDLDGDGVINELDPDDDGDGIPDEEDPDHPEYKPPVEWEDIYNCTLTEVEKLRLLNELEYATIRELRQKCNELGLDWNAWTTREPYILLIFESYGCEPPGYTVDPEDLDDDGVDNDLDADPWDASDSRTVVVPGGELLPPDFGFAWIQANSQWILILLFLLLLLLWLERNEEEDKDKPRELSGILKPMFEAK